MNPSGVPTQDFGLPLYVGLAEFGGTPDEPFSTRAHRHPNPELCVVTGGGTMFVGDESWAVEGTTVIVVPAGAIHWWRFTSAARLWVVGVATGAMPQTATALNALAAHGVVAVPDDDAAAIDTVLRLARRRFEEEPGQTGAAGQHVRSVLAEVERWASAVPLPASRGRNAELVTRFLEAVAAGRARSSVAEIAEELGVSAGHLGQVVRVELGSSPRRVIGDRTLREAQYLLAHADDSAASIAVALGFADASQFGRFFRQHTGETPIGYRERLAAAPVSDGAADE